MTEKNIFVFKVFFHKTFQILVYFLRKNCSSPEKSHPPFPATPSTTPPPPAERGRCAHYVCGILLFASQQLRCLVCCAPVCGQSIQRSRTVSLHCHFLAVSLVCVHSTWLHLKIYIFYTLPNEKLNQFYHVAIGSMLLYKHFLLCNHMTDCFVSFSTQST